MCGEKIKVTGEGNMHAVCPACNALETWKHVALCKKMKKKRDYWVSKSSKKLNDAVKKAKASTCERKIVNGMIKDARKHFNRESNFWTNNQVLVMREVFREIVVKFG